jgi:hypothetical protein
MGPGEALVGVAVCVVLVALAALIFAIYSKRLAFKQRKLELETQAAGNRSPEVKMLEKRVRVLERIATDRGHDVAREIEALRDQRFEEGEGDVALESLGRERA